MSFAPRGILPAMVTPLNDREEVNEKALRSLVDFLVDSGVHGIFVVGSQGEAYALSQDEKKSDGNSGGANSQTCACICRHGRRDHQRGR